MTRSDLLAWLAAAARWYLGVLFAGAAFHKIAAPHDFAVDIATYDILPLSLVNLTAITLPWIELVAGLLLLSGVRIKAAALLVCGMMLVFLAALTAALARGLDMSCGCFASQGAENDPISWLTVVRDLFWFGLGCLVLIWDRGFAGLERLIERRRAFMREFVMVPGLILAIGLAAPALSQSPECDALSGAKRELALRLFETEHLYDCCDGTIASCLRARPTCALAVRLASGICRRLTAGQDEARIRRSLSRRARSMVGGHQPAKLDLAGAPMAGATDAPVTVAVFACARCPHCSQLVPVLHDEILHGRLKGKARIAFLTFPIRGHPGSTEAGLAFTAAARMGQFWEFALHAYRHFNEFSPERQVEWARAMGLDPSVFSTLMADPATREMLVASKKQGVANGIEETPALFINGRRWVADLEAAELADAIEEEAAKLGGDIWTKP